MQAHPGGWFVYSKQKNVPEGMKGNAGDIWTWTAIDADTKLAPSWLVGSRDGEAARVFMADLASRLRGRVHLTSDGHKPHLQAVEGAFGADVDCAMLVKLYGGVKGEGPAGSAQRKYSPAECVGIHKAVITEAPDEAHVSTSFAERANLTLRMHMRWFTRLTNAFAKKVENHEAAVALHFMHYNFVRQHRTLGGISPAMAAGVTDKLWEMEDVAQLVQDWEHNQRGDSN